jgi:hypothetical protein
MGNVQYSLSQLLSAPRPQRGCSAMEACKKKKKVEKGSAILKMRLLRGITM